MLTTTQQTALALGVATLGSLFLSLASPQSFGVRDAFVLVVAVEAAIAVVVSVACRALPQPGEATVGRRELAADAEAAYGVDQAA